MSLGRAHADPKDVSDLFISLAFRQEAHYFPLPSGEFLPWLRFSAIALRAMEKIGKQELGDFTCKKGLVLGKRLNRFHEISMRVGLKDEAFRARFENLWNKLFNLVGGENEDLRLGQAAFDLLRGLQAIELGHAHIHHYHVGLEREGLLDRLTAGRSDAANLPARLSLDHRAGAFAHHIMIVGDKNSYSWRC